MAHPITFGRTFVLYRDSDPTGVSGTGTVADGCEFPDGTVVIRWRGETPSTVIWPSITAAVRVHGHGGSTRIVWAASASQASSAEPTV